MRTNRWSGALVIALVAAPAAAHAQVMAGAFGARGPEAEAPWRWGGGIAVGSGAVLLRASAALEPRGSRLDSVVSASSSRWIGDGDLVVSASRAFAPRRLRPYVFGGYGMQSAAAAGAAPIPHWSYGGGLAFASGSAELSVESRVRELFDDAAPGYFTDGERRWELRAGLTFRLPGAPSLAGLVPGGRAASSGGSTPRIPGASRTVGGEVLPTAERYLGVDYKWGGDSPSEGFDCSGFVRYVFRQHEVALPRTSRQMSESGVSVSRSLDRARPGDLLFFAERGEAVSHVAIFVGKNRIIHSSSSGGGVRYDDLGSSRGRWFRDRVVSVRRMTTDGSSILDQIRDLERAWRASGSALTDRPDRAPVSP